nr:unnamed protein product [Digitaria exilis]
MLHIQLTWAVSDLMACLVLGVAVDSPRPPAKAFPSSSSSSSNGSRSGAAPPGCCLEHAMQVSIAFGSHDVVGGRERTRGEAPRVCNRTGTRACSVYKTQALERRRALMADWDSAFEDGVAVGGYFTFSSGGSVAPPLFTELGVKGRCRCKIHKWVQQNSQRQN